MTTLFTISPFTMHKHENIAVIGLDSVGVSLAIWARREGYNVIGIDFRPDRVEKLRQQISPFADSELARKYNLHPFDVSSDALDVVHADTVVLCSPPHNPHTYEDRMAREYLKKVSHAIGPYLQEGQLVILQSVLNKEISVEPIKNILEKESGLQAGRDFYLAHFPQEMFDRSATERKERATIGSAR